MADPRARVTFRYIGAVYATFAFDSTITYDNTKAQGSASTGLAVTMTGNDTVGLTQDGNIVVGRLLRVQTDGYCTVQIIGMTLLPVGTSGTGAATYGQRVVGATGASSAKGYIRGQTATTGSYVQATVTEAQNLRGIVIDNNFSGELQNVATTLVTVLLG